jgi:hypothetical protein
VAVLAWALVAVTPGCSPESGESRDPAPGPSSEVSFQDLNGFMWFYTTAQDLRFADIERRMDELHAGGIRVLGIYSPYDGNPEKYLGCAPRDFYTTAPESGSLADFAGMVEAAHARGMKVVAYFVNIYIDEDSAFFRTAERQYAAGDRESREVSAFRWSDDERAPLPEPAAGPSAWMWSDVAGAYYWSLWGEPGFDRSLPGARAEIERVETFWLDLGLDGFMWDAGFVDPAFRPSMVELPLRHTPGDKWLTFESTAAELASTYQAFGLTSWFAVEDDDSANAYSFIANGEDGADDLEEGLARVDEARAAGKLTHAWTLWEEPGYPGYPDEDRMRVQEAALLAGAGSLFGHPDHGAYSAWPAARRSGWEQVLSTVNRHPALHPSASRERVPAGPGRKAYAMLRVARDESQAALLVYNLSGTARAVTVDLERTSVIAGQVPTDLVSGDALPPITGASYSIQLPAHGWVFLEVGVQ